MDIEQIRKGRDFLLKVTDFTQLNDAPFTVEEKQEWALYRQELRDITTQTITEDFLFPEPPVLLESIPISFHTPKLKE